MLSKFKEEREKRKMPPPSSTPSAAPAGAGGSPAPGGAPPRAGSERDFRASRDEYRERDRGYERHGSSRYEYVFSIRAATRLHTHNNAKANVAETGPARPEGGGTEQGRALNFRSVTLSSYMLCYSYIDIELG